MPTYIGAEYQVLVTNMAGVPYAEMANAVVESVTWELNGWGEATISLSVLDAQASELAKAHQTKREVQIWRNGVLIWWGVYVAATADQNTVTFTAYGLLWYFSRRYFGPIHSDAMPQMLVNGSMASLTGWTTAAGVTSTVNVVRKRTGAASIKLVTSGSGIQDYYIGQGVAIPTPARVVPLTFTLSGWQYIETLTTPDFFNRALALGIGGTNFYGADIIKPDEQIGVWRYREASYTLAASSTTPLSAVLYAPTAGTVYWDQAQVTYEQKTGANEGEDWTQYLQRIFDYGAGLTGGGTEGSPLWWGAPVLKSSLGMTWTGTGGPAAGSLLQAVAWDHADEGNIFTAMAELVGRNVLDFEITWPANGRSRTMTAWTPRKGSTKTGLAAEDGRNITAFTYAVDGRRRASDIRVVGRAPGKLKEEAQTGGPTVADGFQLETIISPPFEISGQQLRDQATVEHARLVDPISTPTITVKAGPYMGDVQPSGTAEAGAPLTVGDTIPIRINHGWVQEAANRRIVKMTLRPATEELDLVTNES